MEYSRAIDEHPLRKNHYKAGDEVIIPVLCWPTSLWPFVQFGLKPVFVDINLNTLNISIDDLEKKINSKTRAIVLVNVLGNCSDLYKIKSIAKKRKIILIEDNCESLGSRLKNKYLSKIGPFGPNFTCFYFFFNDIPLKKKSAASRPNFR